MYYVANADLGVRSSSLSAFDLNEESVTGLEVHQSGLYSALWACVIVVKKLGINSQRVERLESVAPFEDGPPGLQRVCVS